MTAPHLLSDCLDALTTSEHAERQRTLTLMGYCLGCGDLCRAVNRFGSDDPSTYDESLPLCSCHAS